jgi:hypothetical protein
VEILDFPIPTNRLANILRIYEREHTRFERTLESFSITLNSLALDKRCETVFGHVCGTDAMPKGYAVVKVFNSGDGRTGELTEYAGERKAVLDVLRYVILKHDLGGISLCIPDSDKELIAFLRSFGVKVANGTLPGFTAKILSTSRAVMALVSHSENPPGHVMPFPLPGANFV